MGDRLLIVLAALSTAVLAAGCSDDSNPVCDAKSSFDSSVEQLRDFNLEDQSLSDLESMLSEVSSSARDLKDELTQENQQLIDQLEGDIQAVQSSLGGGGGAAEDLQAIATGIEGIITDVEQLDQSVQSDLESC